MPQAPPLSSAKLVCHGNVVLAALCAGALLSAPALAEGAPAPEAAPPSAYAGAQGPAPEPAPQAAHASPSVSAAPGAGARAPAAPSTSPPAPRLPARARVTGRSGAHAKRAHATARPGAAARLHVPIGPMAAPLSVPGSGHRAGALLLAGSLALALLSLAAVTMLRLLKQLQRLGGLSAGSGLS